MKIISLQTMGLLLLSGFAAVAVFCAYQTTHGSMQVSPSLLDASKPVLNLGPIVRDYYWKGNNTIIVNKQVPVGDSLIATWFQYDLSTHTNHAIPLATFADTPQTSPDGRWLLGCDTSTSARLVWVITSLEKGSVATCSVPASFFDHYLISMYYTGSSAWLADSRHWIWIPSTHADDKLHVQVFDRVPPKLIREVTVTLPGNSDSLIPDPLPTGVLGVRKNIVFCTSGDTILQPATTVKLFQFGLSERSVTATRAIVHLPRKSRANLLVSPDANKIAWLLYGPDSAEDWIDIWVSDASGNRMKHIGAIPSRNNGVTSDLYFRWTPDNQRLSFVYKGIIYAVRSPL